MNFKRMNVLLIMLALVLLVGIGSISAASDDGADIISDSITDDVLSDSEVTLVSDPEDPVDEKINTTVVSENLTARDNETVSIPVSVKDNESNDVSVSENDFSVAEGDNSLEFTYNGTINLINELSLGNHTLIISYLGNDSYANSSAEILLSIFGNKTMTTPENVTANSTSVEVPIDVTNGVNSTELNNENTEVTLFYKDGDEYASKTIGLTDGRLVFTEEEISLLSAYLDIHYFDDETNITNRVNIIVQTNVSAVGGRFKYELPVVIPINVTDIYNSTLEIGSEDIIVYDGRDEVHYTYENGNLTLSGLDSGNHTLTILYMGNEIYSNSTSEISVQVYEDKKIDADDSVAVNETEELVVPVTVSDGVDDFALDESNTNVTLYYDNTNKTIVGWTYENGAIKFTETDANLTGAILRIAYTDGEVDLVKDVAVQVQTSISASIENQRVNENEEANITVSVSDIYGAIEVGKDNLAVYDAGEELDFAYADGNITVTGLAAGNHTLTILYKGSDLYTNSSADVNVSIVGAWRIELQDLAATDANDNASLAVNITNSVDYLEVSKDNLTLALTYINASGEIETMQISEFDVADNVITFHLPECLYGNLTVFSNQTDNLTAVAAVKIATQVIFENVTALANSTFNFTLAVKDIHGNEIPLNLSDIIVLCDGKALSNVTFNDSVIIVNDLIDKGVHNLTVQYKGNESYHISENTVSLAMIEIETPSSIDVNSTKTGILSINVTDGVNSYDLSPENLNITVSYLDENNETVYANASIVKIENGTLTFALEENNFTSGNLTISYNGEFNKTITLNNIINVVIIPIKTNSTYQTGNITFQVFDEDDIANLTNKTISATFYVTVGSIRLGSSASLEIDENGIASLNLNTQKFPTLYYFMGSNYIPVGEYEFTLSGEGQLKGSNTTNVTISKANVIITANKFTGYYGTEDKFKITVTSAETGELMKDVLLKLYLPQTVSQNYTVKTNENGTCEIAVSGLVGGTYDVTVSTNDNNTNNASKDTSIVINKIKVKINLNSKTMYYNSGSTAKIKITNSKTGKAVAGVYVYVRLYTSAKKYKDYLFQTNKKGIVEFSAPLNVGKHKIIVNTADTRYEAKSVTRTITVKSAPAKIKAAKKTAYYKQGKYFTVKVINTKNKKPIYNAKLNIRVFVTSKKYYNFNGRTGANGKLNLVINFNPGKYKVVIIDKDSNMVAKQISSKIVVKKAPAKFKASKVTAKKKANKYFKVKVINKKTKKIIPGVKVKVKVYTGKKSKTYTVKTNSKGIAKLSTKSLKVGKHKVVISSANKYVKASKKTSSIKITK